MSDTKPALYTTIRQYFLDHGEWPAGYLVSPRTFLDFCDYLRDERIFVNHVTTERGSGVKFEQTVIYPSKGVFDGEFFLLAT